MGLANGDVRIPEGSPSSLLRDLHIKFVSGYSAKDNYEYVMSEFLRINGIYWSVTLMDLIGSRERLGDPKEMFTYVRECFDPESGGYRPAPRHDPHLLYTLSAIQIAVLYDALHIIPKARKNRIIQF
uniref:Geranylgeranyl transferase type II subunit beta n=1 Tax=Caligus rogercresseyi TaxID=217165 RepID=C1BQB1_CALRO|nr:Geranylgeranyl transferase type-2 subunit beta [Caligus rogercresseyi]